MDEAEVAFEELEVMEPDSDDDLLDEVWRPESAVDDEVRTLEDVG